MKKVRNRLVVISLLTLFASCGEPEPSSPDAQPSPGGCGDRVVDPEEECDTGGASTTCDADCTAPACGDGSLNLAAGELCEDGNTTSADGCSAGCLSELSITGIDWADFVAQRSAIWHFDGTLWRMTGIPGQRRITDHWAAAPMDYYITGTHLCCGEPLLPDAEFLHHHNPQLSEELEEPLGPDGWSLNAIWGASTAPVVFYAIFEYTGPNGLTWDVSRYDDTGWSSTGFSRQVAITAIWGSAADDIYVAGEEGVLHHYDGTGWTQIELAVESPSEPGRMLDFLAVTGTGPDDVILVGGSDSPASHSVLARYDGERWTISFDVASAAAGLEDLPIQAAWSRGDGSLAIVDRSRIGLFENDAWQFFDYSGQANFTDIVGLPNGHLLAASFEEVFYYDGQVWKTQEVISTPPGDDAVGPFLQHISFAPGAP